jgi:hypothetical protein
MIRADRPQARIRGIALGYLLRPAKCFQSEHKRVVAAAGSV